MKSNRKIKTLILIVLVIFFAFSPIFFISPSFTAKDHDISSNYNEKFNNDILKIFAVSGKIHIDNNWTATKTAGICTGNGTYSEPYVIEDLVIDGGVGSRGHCILIENSIVYFRIENCTVYNTVVWGSGNAGIRLYNTSNAQLIENDCSYDSEGIDLVYSNNNTISGNTLSNNYRGIDLSTSNNNIISGNNVSGSDMYQGGIMASGNNNTITGNILNHYGISAYGFNNSLSGNIMNMCGLRLVSGSVEQLNSLNIDASNLVNGRPLYYYTNEMNLDQNDFLDAGQVILVNCNDSFISNLNISYTHIGISLLYSNNNEISGNNVNNNFYYGLYLYGSHNNLISRNEANNCSGMWLGDGDGIYLFLSNYNTISSNTANNNYGFGIRVYNCDNNQILGNNLTNNHNSGIYLYASHTNEISGNYVSENWNGIYIRNSNDNLVSENTANDNANGITVRESILNDISKNIANGNDRGILVAISSDNNTILENTAKGNEYGIYIGVCFYNEILGNDASYNDYGIYLAGCFYNTISENSANNNLYGIYSEVSLNNTIMKNSANFNFYGIKLDENSNDNVIYLNCFNNSVNAVDDGTNNQWDNGINGNYWADYTGSDADGDGIGDIPYNITGSAGSQDRFPLMTCPLPRKGTGGLPFELIILISIISGGAMIGVATILLIRRKRKRIE